MEYVEIVQAQRKEMDIQCFVTPITLISIVHTENLGFLHGRKIDKHLF